MHITYQVKKTKYHVKLEPPDKNLDIKVLVVNVIYGYFINQIT